MTGAVATAPDPLVGRATGRPGAAGRLTLVELRRYLARAGVRWLVVGMVAIVAVTAFGAWRASRPPTQVQLDQAQAQYETDVTSWSRDGDQMVAQCETAQAEQQKVDPDVDFGCDLMTPRLENYLPHQATFAQSGADWVGQVATFLLLLSLIVGATFVAAEFSTGSITTWLTFEPRRGRVFASKTVVATLATGVVALVVTVLAVGACWAATALNGAVGDVSAAMWADLGNRAGRIGAAAGATALLGAGLAFLLRHTAAVIAVVIGWFVAIDGLLVQGLLRAPRWAVALNLQAWLDAGSTYYQEGSCSAGGTGEVVCSSGERALSMTSGALSLLVLVVVVTAGALLVFRRRDVA